MTAARLPITLVMVSYNKADTIGLSIESAATGSMKPDLIVISDDGSDDGTPEVAEETAAKHDIPLRFIRHQRVGTYRIQTMRNTCAANAIDGGIVFLSDSDCLFGEYAIETHQAIHQRHPLAIGTGPRFEFLEGSSGPFQTTFTTLEIAHFPTGTYVAPCGANYSFRKSLWQRLGGFDRAFEASYGMEEFEFSKRSELIGGECVSDPGAYVFHIPHETVFGNRNAFRNIGVFAETFPTQHTEFERQYIATGVTPWYWQGRRKTPLLGDKIELDSWGAPAGFVPPLELQLSRTLRPLTDPAERVVADGDQKALAELRRKRWSLDEKRLARTSPARIAVQDLGWVLKNFQEMPELKRRLEHWLTGTRKMEAEMAGTPA
ncbi:MAG: glycosyltransferase family 2 protein [Planctomycetota bacterium]|jgi:GT2 family glycosyltransferase